jgi:beta-lactam-binding protein with PASTA domain
LTQDRAATLLKDANLLPPQTTALYAEEYNEKVAKDLIISESPPAGTSIDRSVDTTVQIVVSLGKEPPDPPDGVSAEPTNVDQVQITWQPAARATYYEVTRIVDGVSTVIANKLYSTSYMDTGLKPGSSYSYTVTAVNAVGGSEPSDPALAVTPTVSPVSSLVPSDQSSGSPDSTGSSESTGGADNGGANSDTQRRQFEIRFRVPRNVQGQRHVQIYVVDSTGNTLVYDRMHDPGDMVDANETGFGAKITFQIYLDGELVKQKVL